MTRGKALADFMRTQHLSYEDVNRLGITIQPCKCGLECCPGWLAVNSERKP